MNKNTQILLSTFVTSIASRVKGNEVLILTFAAAKASPDYGEQISSQTVLQSIYLKRKE